MTNSIFSPAISVTLTLTIIGLIIYWFGLFHLFYSPSRINKENVYKSGFLFVLRYMLSPILIAIALVSIIDDKTILEIPNERLIVIFLGLYGIYMIELYLFFRFTKPIENDIDNCNESFINKKAINKYSKYLRTASSVIIITSTIIIYLAYILYPKNIDISTMIYIIAIVNIMSSFGTMSVISMYVGYSNCIFYNVTITIKGIPDPQKGVILEQNEYLRLYNKETKTEIDYNINEIISIEYSTSY